jgi:hypothetical protein
VAVALALVVCGSARPSHDRDWPTEVPCLPYATIDGERVTVRNIRNFDYRTETEFTLAYYDPAYGGYKNTIVPQGQYHRCCVLRHLM